MPLNRQNLSSAEPALPVEVLLLGDLPGVPSRAHRGPCPDRRIESESESAPDPLTSGFPFRHDVRKRGKGARWGGHRPGTRWNSSRRPWSCTGNRARRTPRWREAGLRRGQPGRLGQEADEAERLVRAVELEQSPVPSVHAREVVDVYRGVFHAVLLIEPR